MGPVLWNVLYDDMLDVEMPAGVQLVAFADDITVTRTGASAEHLLSPSIDKVSRWMRDN